MNRFCLALIVAGLVTIATLVATVLGSPTTAAVPSYAPLAAAFAGLSIVAGLVLLEVRTGGRVVRVS
ncbi:hypothetical protein ACE7GA_23840 [Roseomonas sp. CCTCC AB2023176]|uniref:hypothetical protein n=1 Tax=Roseomonas sp. CCTCC AB2023176 TaxID=3342640 RepID=UPI0035D6F8A6